MAYIFTVKYSVLFGLFNFGLGLGLLNLASTSTSASRFWPRPRPQVFGLGLGLGLKHLASFNISDKILISEWRRWSVVKSTVSLCQRWRLTFWTSPRPTNFSCRWAPTKLIGWFRNWVAYVWKVFVCPVSLLIHCFWAVIPASDATRTIETSSETSTNVCWF